jgi:hypothetical protein
MEASNNGKKVGPFHWLDYENMACGILRVSDTDQSSCGGDLNTVSRCAAAATFFP